MSMRLEDIYRLAIKMGIEQDPRAPKELESELALVKKRFDKMDEKEKARFDMDSLWNPYADSRLLAGDPDLRVEGVLWGIDIDAAEVLLADRLREKGRPVDAVIAHHPQGRARIGFPDVVRVQEHMLHNAGVPITAAEDIVIPRAKEVKRGVWPSNFNQTVDAARLLGLGLMCLHSCCDNLVQQHLVKLIEKRAPDRLDDLLKVFMEEPEYEVAARHGVLPEIFVGDKDRRVGKVYAKMCGGTSGPKEMYEHMARAGVGTYICMHIPDAHIEEARKHHINVVVSGHMASDSLGINLLADEVEKKGVQIIPCSGFIRVKRSA
jgi:putative NIF3 family GTP cyclohydrolase 1 type 2